MSDHPGIEPPRSAPVPEPLVQPLTVPKPSRLPWIIGAIAIFLVVGFGLIIGVFALSAAIAAANDRNDLAAAEKTVRDLDDAYADADCDEFEAVTTEDARDDILGDDYDCDTWEDQAATLTVDGDYLYAVEVTDSRKRGDRITVTTEETYGDEDSNDYEYVLERDNGGWVIRAYGEK